MAEAHFVGINEIPAIPKLQLYSGTQSPFRGKDPGLELIEDFSFIDSREFVWIAHAKDITDGASVPWFSQPIIGGPLDRPYLGPAVLHDVYCRDKSRPKWDVDRMFYEAMLCNGVPKWKALAMWSAVYAFGQWW